MCRLPCCKAASLVASNRQRASQGFLRHSTHAAAGASPASALMYDTDSWSRLALRVLEGSLCAAQDWRLPLRDGLHSHKFGMQGSWCFRFHDETGATGLISHLQTALKALLLVPRPESKLNMQGGAGAAALVEDVNRNLQEDDSVSLQAVLDQLGPVHVQQLMHEALRDPEFPR